jgi:hypothetical protein
LIRSFRESLCKPLDEKKLQKVQRRIQLITARLSTQTTSFANRGEISKEQPVRSLSNPPGPVHVKQESGIPTDTKKNPTCNIRLKALQMSSFSYGGAMNNCANLVVFVSNYQIYMLPIKANNPGNNNWE